MCFFKFFLTLMVENQISHQLSRIFRFAQRLHIFKYLLDHGHSVLIARIQAAAVCCWALARAFVRSLTHRRLHLVLSLVWIADSSTPHYFDGRLVDLFLCRLGARVLLSVQLLSHRPKRVVLVGRSSSGRCWLAAIATIVSLMLLMLFLNELYFGRPELWRIATMQTAVRVWRLMTMRRRRLLVGSPVFKWLLRVRARLGSVLVAVPRIIEADKTTFTRTKMMMAKSAIWISYNRDDNPPPRCHNRLCRRRRRHSDAFDDDSTRITHIIFLS